MSQPVVRPPWYYHLLAAPLLALAHLPLSLLYGLAGMIYLLLAYVVRYRRGVVLDNLRHAFPEKTAAERSAIARQFYWHFAQVIVEVLKLAAISPAELSRRARFSNPQLISRVLAKQQLVLGLSSHLGNWEWILGRAGAVYPGQIVGVYKPLSNKFFEWFVRRLRTRLGPVAVPMQGTLRYLVQHREQGRVISLLIDQAAGPDDRPYWTSFLHRDAGFYTSADRLAPQFNAIALYVSIQRERRGYYVINVRAMPSGPLPGLPDTASDAAQYPITEAFVRQLEADIRAAPEQYLWTHRRWKHQRPSPN